MIPRNLAKQMVDTLFMAQDQPEPIVELEGFEKVLDSPCKLETF